MWLNAIAGVVVAACIAAGAWAGALVTGLRIAALVLSYGAAVVLGPALAPDLGTRFGLGGVLATVVAGSAVFVAANLVLWIAARLARRLRRRNNADRSPRDRFIGAIFGAVRGALIAMMLVYLAMWLDALRAIGKTPAVPAIGESVAVDVTSGVVRSAIESAVDTSDPAARFTARFAAQPSVSAAELQSLIDDPAFARLRGDARFWND